MNRDYLVPTEERSSWLPGRTELPATVVDTYGLEGVGVIEPMGLDNGGLGTLMLIGGLATEFAKFVAILFAAFGGGIAIEEEAGKPSRAAIICVRSWDLNCGHGRVFGRIAFIAVADITDAIAVIAAGFGSSGFGRCRYRYITAAISVTDRYLNPCSTL
ncbi:hypothetical protein GOBAR_AA22224 [Gossypium barbadense]|uniref:Uncharacterized protein n=1 Tax=Gossypium barbadense TaxID=3634 RepID=A0A2P5X575_GOSBA|nr:hypothetical protein GOBAR_AA22224 [Gossypium barbadense]